MKYSMAVYLVFGLMSLAATVQKNHITCKIDGVQKEFSMNLIAVYSRNDGLVIAAFGGPPKSGEYLAIRLPLCKTGKYTVKDTPTLSFNYSRSNFSSKSGDHYGAHEKEERSKFNVTITKCGDVGELIEGSFSAVATSFPNHQLSIADGVFSVIRQPDSKK
jgi:hypothetical protein